jgi:AcrR family transcriptional regulator
MSRWNPNARGRLEQAAYDLFLERGYEQTTVADIAARAGLTERTFFRHYADKREVFFGASGLLLEEMLGAFDAMPPSLPALEAVRIAVEAAAGLMHGRRALARERQTIVEAHRDLQERGLIKRATLTAALADALRKRGVGEYEAGLSADIGMAVFHVAFTRWLDEPTGREFVDVIHEGFERLRAVADGSGSGSEPAARVGGER